jgi:hypothetical protein
MIYVPPNWSTSSKGRVVAEADGNVKRARIKALSERAEEYRRKMIECRRLALASSDPAVRQIFFDIADQWRELYEQNERLAGMPSLTHH